MASLQSLHHLHRRESKPVAIAAVVFDHRRSCEWGRGGVFIGLPVRMILGGQSTRTPRKAGQNGNMKSTGHTPAQGTAPEQTRPLQSSLGGFYRQNRCLYSEHPLVNRAKLQSMALPLAPSASLYKSFPSLVVLSLHGPHFFLVTTTRPCYRENTVINRVTLPFI